MKKKRQNVWATLSAGFLLACVGGFSAPSGAIGQDAAADAALSPSGDAADPAIPLDAAAEPAVAESAEPLSGSRQYSLSLKQLGANYPLNLRGIEGSNTVPFNIRDDEVVTAARLHLRYAYSPALITELSHINVLVNDELAFTIPVPKEEAGKNLDTDVDLPVWLIGSFNKLRLQLIGHYTMQCEDPLHSSLWANISNKSSLELTVTPVALANDLNLLPQPFFDRRDVRPLKLPFVFGSAPDNSMLEAAGMVASWFGSLSDYRGATFPTDITGQTPAEGNAVVFAIGGTAPAALDARPLSGPTVAVAPNPADPNGKLLLVLGRNAEELKQAARALTLGSQALSGQVATITKVDEVKPRKPYDAPRWLRSDRPVRFGELADPKVFSVAGYTPDLVRLDVRVPPDLFGWRDKGVPVHLKYRYTPRPTNDKSTLTVNVDDQYVRSYPLLSNAVLKRKGMLDKLLGEDGTVPAEAKLNIPLYRFGADSQMRYQFNYDYLKEGECRDVIIDNARSGIDPDSTIDISGYSHWLAMPDLAAFAGVGFPFTRLADLSETTVVMPDAAVPADLSGYLALMGQMGRSTGYPAVGVTVASAAQIDAQKDHDLLVIDAGARQPLLKQWAKYAPAAVSGGQRSFALSDLPSRVLGWFSPDRRENAERRFNGVNFSSDGANGAVMGFESPLSGGRSVVVVSSSGDDGWERVLAALQGKGKDEKIEGEVRGSLAVVRGNTITSLVGEQDYYVGNLGWFKHLRWWLSAHPLMLLALGLLVVVLLAVLVYLLLRATARRRLVADGK